MHIYLAASLHYKLQAVDIKRHCNAAQLTWYSLRVLDLLFENLTSVRVNTRAQMFFCWSTDRQFSRLSFFHPNLWDHFTKDGLSLIQSFIIMYSSCEKFCFCLSHSDKFTKLPCSLVDSCVGDGCDKGSLMFWLWHIWSARNVEIGELWIYTF